MNIKSDNTNITKIAARLEEHLLAQRNHRGTWDGCLSGSALSTAVAAFALWLYDREAYQTHIQKGLQWLAANSNADGGWGDTVKSSSNMSTTLLCWAALAMVEDDPTCQKTIHGAEKWLLKRLPSLAPEKISKSILDHYQDDQTFSVPILAMCALAGRLGPDGWDKVPQLPYQLAVLPDRCFKWMNLRVVSYAIPALIAIGLVKHNNSRQSPLMVAVNRWVQKKVLEVLAGKQPSNGGFLEASPLTGFVLMSLVGAGQRQHAVCMRAAAFLEGAMRPDGSWPIDTNLATWVTTLSINALNTKTLDRLGEKPKAQLITALLDQQFKQMHPFTRSKPGGWAWTPLPGGVPDGDDTSGALLALKKLAPDDPVVKEAASHGLKWLMSIQNRDGGIPTFCRGWGKLPFDCSCPDITAHALRAFIAWREHMEPSLQKRLKKAIGSMLIYLLKARQANGSWLPLWFGNEQEKQHSNPVYGTAMVLLGLKEAQRNGYSFLTDWIHQGAAFLHAVQNSDGGWGGNKDVPSSIEETALALRALAGSGKRDMVDKGTAWLVEKVNLPPDQTLPAAPIGLYFASLWYYEEMYPLVFACAALNEIGK